MSTSGTTQQKVDWSAVADGWDTHRGSIEEFKTGLTEQLLTFLALQTGERVLELGAGSGELARRLSAQVGDSGRVLATDVAPGMVALIESTTAHLPNVHTARLDAADIGHCDALFDAVVFRMGLMFVTPPESALAEIRRVLRPGGRMAVTTWAGPEHNMWLAAVGMAAMFNGMISGPMPTEPGGPMSLSDPAALAALARSAGFSDVSVEPVELAFTAADVDDHIAQVTALAPPLAAAYDGATADQHAAFRSSVTDLDKPFLTQEGLLIPGQALLLTAS